MKKIIRVKESRGGRAFPKTLWCLKCHSEVLVFNLQDIQCSCTRAKAENVKKLYAEQLFVNTGEEVSSDYIWVGEVDIPYWVEIDSEEAKREMEKRKRYTEQIERKKEKEQKKVVKKWEKEIGKPLLDELELARALEKGEIKGGEK